MRSVFAGQGGNKLAPRPGGHGPRGAAWARRCWSCCPRAAARSCRRAQACAPRRRPRARPRWRSSARDPRDVGVKNVLKRVSVKVTFCQRQQWVSSSGSAQARQAIPLSPCKQMPYAVQRHYINTTLEAYQAREPHVLVARALRAQHQRVVVLHARLGRVLQQVQQQHMLKGRANDFRNSVQQPSLAPHLPRTISKDRCMASKEVGWIAGSCRSCAALVASMESSLAGPQQKP